MKKIKGQIVDMQVRKSADAEPGHSANPELQTNVVHMHEKLERPAALRGTTYKIKTPLSEHALYVTINDLILNTDTDRELVRPFEIFINSKSMDHFQWIVALTRIISAVFRKGGDVAFLVEELRSVFDPRGGYLQKGGRFVPSLVAEIGDVIETHLKIIGLIIDEPLDPHRAAYLDEKLKQANVDTPDRPDGQYAYPTTAAICRTCKTKAVVYMDGCLTCLACGDSKCG
ncbi:MAG: NrdJb [Proteobacteria bacterium]|nr:NrdJb [Pseudomonadota bacterium]